MYFVKVEVAFKFYLESDKCENQKSKFLLIFIKKYVRNRVTNVMFCNVTYYTFITTLQNTKHTVSKLFDY